MWRKLLLLCLLPTLVGWPEAPKDMTIFWDDYWLRAEQDKRVPEGFTGCWKLPKKRRGNWQGAVRAAKLISAQGFPEGVYIPINDATDYRYVALREIHNETVLADGSRVKARKHGVTLFCNLKDSRR